MNLPPRLRDYAASLRHIPMPPQTRGVYIICDGDEILRVGRTRDIERNAVQKAHNVHAWSDRQGPQRATDIYFVQVDDDAIAEQVLAALVRDLQPRYNLRPYAGALPVVNARVGVASSDESVLAALRGGAL